MIKKGFKIADALLIVAFVLVIALPLVFADREGGKLSEAENRRLATFPDLSLPLKDGTKTAVERWINDNIGGRSLASWADTQLQWNLFRTSAKSDTIVGKDDWLFFYQDWIGYDYRHVNLLSEETLAQFVNDATVVTDYIASQGAFPMLLMLPDKKTIYPEKYPDGLIVQDGPSRADALYAYMRQNSRLPVMWIYDALTQARDRGAVYSPRIDNAHWNALGAFIGYQELCKALSERFPNLRYRTLEESSIQTYENTKRFNAAVPISEEDYRITTGLEDTWASDPAYMERFPYLTYAGDPADWRLHSANEDSSLPSMLFVGDSYIRLLQPYLSQSCSEFTFLHLIDMQYLPELMEELHPDIVVIEWVERQWEGLAYPKMWETATKLWHMQNP